jgi:hypothetical protein
MASDRCHHGLLHGMCSICINREREIRESMKAKKQETTSSVPVPRKKRVGMQ